MQERLAEIDGYWLSWHPRDKDHTGQFYRTWYDGESRQTRRALLQPGTTNLQEAKILLAEWVTNHRIEQLKITPNKTPEVTPLSLVFLTHWEKHGAHIASAKSVKNSLAIWSEFWGRAMVSDLTPMRQDEFIRWMQAKGWSAGYISRVISDGRAALNRARKYQEVTSVPYIFGVKRPEPPERALTMQQLATVINLTHELTKNGARVPGREHLFKFIMIGIATWARPDAIFDLTMAQVNFESKRISLNPDGRDQTNKYRPVVAMPDFIVPLLKTADHQIVNYYGRKIVSSRGFFHPLQGKHGLPEWLQAKSIRHTMAKHARAAGVDDWHVSGQLGHRKPGRSTTEIYAKYDPSYLSETRRFTDEFVRELQKLVRPSLGFDP